MVSIFALLLNVVTPSFGETPDPHEVENDLIKRGAAVSYIASEKGVEFSPPTAQRPSFMMSVTVNGKTQTSPAVYLAKKGDFCVAAISSQYAKGATNGQRIGITVPIELGKQIGTQAIFTSTALPGKASQGIGLVHFSGPLCNKGVDPRAVMPIRKKQLKNGSYVRLGLAGLIDYNLKVLPSNSGNGIALLQLPNPKTYKGAVHAGSVIATPNLNGGFDFAGFTINISKNRRQVWAATNRQLNFVKGVVDNLLSERIEK